MSAQKILDELASNETLQYIQKLESDNDRLRKELMSTNNRLLDAKVKKSKLIDIGCIH